LAESFEGAPSELFVLGTSAAAEIERGILAFKFSKQKMEAVLESRERWMEYKGFEKEVSAKWRDEGIYNNLGGMA